MRLDLKSKLLFLTAVPMVAIFILSIGRIVYDFDQQQKLKTTKEHIAEAKAISRVIHYMQIERGLSSGFTTKTSEQNGEFLSNARQELDSAIKDVLSMELFKTADVVNFSNLQNELKSKRASVAASSISAAEIRSYFTKEIEMLLDAAKKMPALIDNREDRNLLQAYNYLVLSKEHLGQIRAILNEVFILDALSKDNAIFLREQLHGYKSSSENFESTVFDSNELLRYYRKNLKSAALEETFKMVDVVLKSKESGGFGIEPSYWFEQTTKSIDLLKEIEDKLFISLDKTIDKKIEDCFFNMILIFIILLFLSLGILFFSLKSVKKILSMAEKFSDDFENSMDLLEQYKSTVDNAFVVSKTNQKGIITYANDEFCRVSGYAREELLGKPHSIVRHPDTQKDTFKEMWRTIRELKKPWSGELKNLAKDGSAYWMRVYINPILDKEGNVIEYIAMRADISEIQEEKERIRDTLGISIADFAEARHLASEYENAMSATWSIIRTDPDNKITFINETFSKISGYSLDELRGRDCLELRAQKHIDKKDCESLKQTLENKEIAKMQFENIAKDGKSYFVDATVIPIADTKGVIVEHLHLMCNITELVELHVEIEKTQQEIICRMGEASESRSKETGNHIRRVAEYSRLLALKAGLDDKEAELIANASPMHDLGKIAIPDKVLLKPGRLDEDEIKIMRNHSNIGYTILSGSQRALLNAAAVIAKEHHEKYDGSGYPDGIAGEDIHVYARIVAIADVFDALGADRVYKKAWELDKILELFKEEKGKHFDAKLVELFLQNIDEFLQIRDRYKDSVGH